MSTTTVRKQSVRKQFVTTVTALPGSVDEPSMFVTTIDVDRDGDRVIPEGADTRNIVRNSPLLWGHDYGSIPIGALTKLDIIPQRGIKAAWRWLEGDAFAARVRNAWDQGIVRAASIGFISHERRANDYGGHDHLRWEPIEVSLVPVPANPAAVRQLKALGLLDAFRAPRKSDVDLDVTGADVRASLRSPQVRAAITEEAARQVKWAAMPDDAQVLRLDDEREDVLANLTAEDVLSALRSSIGADVATGVRRALNGALGRID